MLALIILTVYLTGLISAIMQPSPRWHAIDRSKGGWILGMIFLGIFFAVPYLICVRPKLEAQANR